MGKEIRIKYIKYSPYHKAAITELSIGGKNTEIVKYAFLECGNLKKVDIQDSIARIGKYAFAECTNLEELKFSNNLHTIEEGAFKNCISLKKVHIPSSIKDIGIGAFAGCRNIESFSGHHVTKDGRCVIIDGTLVAFAPKGLSEYAIPMGVKKIEDFALSLYGDCKIKITFPSSLNTIGKCALFGSNFVFNIEYFLNRIEEINDDYICYSYDELKNRGLFDKIVYNEEG